VPWLRFSDRGGRGTSAMQDRSRRGKPRVRSEGWAFVEVRGGRGKLLRGH
jgi:hypothetical protein